MVDEANNDIQKIQNDYPIVRLFLDLFQTIFLDPEKTTKIFIKIMDAILATSGYEDFLNIAEKPLLELNTLILLFTNYVRGKYISALLNLLKLIPNLNSFVGHLDRETTLAIEEIEYNGTLKQQVEFMESTINYTGIILKILEKKLNIDSNNPYILKCTHIKNSIIKLQSTIYNNANNIDKINIDIDEQHNTIYINFNIFTENENNEFIQSFINNSNNINEQIVNKYNEKKEYIFNKINSSNVIKQLNNKTKIFFSGHFINGCMAVLFTMDKEFNKLLCEIDLCEQDLDISIIKIGTPAFATKQFQQEFSKKKYKLYRFIKPNDKLSYCYINNCVQLTLPIILAKSSVVNDFYNLCNNKIIDFSKDKNNIIVDNNSFNSYYKKINMIMSNTFEYNEDYANYNNNDIIYDEELLQNPFYLTNVD